MMPGRTLQTSDGKSIEILGTGNENDDTFEEAVISIDGKQTNCEVAFEGGNTPTLCFTATSGEATERMTVAIDIPQGFTREFEAIKNGKQPCVEMLNETGKIYIGSYLSRLLIERIEDKAARITRIHIDGDKQWEHTLFRLLARNFGFGIQSDAFESWAAILDLPALGKHRDNLMQVEAIFFGQAGLLDPVSIPDYYRKEALETSYYNTLAKEYKFLSAKFGLKQVSCDIWKSGNTTPHTRIARLAAIYYHRNVSISSIAACSTIEELKSIMQTPIEGYWANHNQFGGTTIAEKATMLSIKHLNLLTINTIVPMLYSYGKHRHEEGLCNRAEDLLYTLPPEENSIVRAWREMGIEATCAADTQALIQLKKEHCRKRKCLDCMFAYRLLKEAMEA